MQECVAVDVGEVVSRSVRRAARGLSARRGPAVRDLAAALARRENNPWRPPWDR